MRDLFRATGAREEAATNRGYPESGFKTEKESNDGVGMGVGLGRRPGGFAAPGLNLSTAWLRPPMSCEYGSRSAL